MLRGLVDRAQIARMNTFVRAENSPQRLPARPFPHGRCLPTTPTGDRSRFPLAPPPARSTSPRSFRLWMSTIFVVDEILHMSFLFFLFFFVVPCPPRKRKCFCFFSFVRPIRSPTSPPRQQSYVPSTGAFVAAKVDVYLLKQRPVFHAALVYIFPASPVFSTFSGTRPLHLLLYHGRWVKFLEELFGNKFSLLLWAGAVLCFIGYSLQQVRTYDERTYICVRKWLGERENFIMPPTRLPPTPAGYIT